MAAPCPSYHTTDAFFLQVLKIFGDYPQFDRLPPGDYARTAVAPRDKGRNFLFSYLYRADPASGEFCHLLETF